MFATGYSMNTEIVTKDEPEMTCAFLTQIAIDFQTYILGTYVEKSSISKKAYNTSILISPKGKELAKYQKIHPFSYMKEDIFYNPGENIVLTKINDLNIGLSICYDLRFPELYRILTFKGAHILVVQANWPKSRSHHWKSLLVARAIECQCFVIGVNRIGKGDNIYYSGDSMAINPDGRIIANAYSEEKVLIFEISKKYLLNYRKKLAFLKDSKLKLYSDYYSSLKDDFLKNI